MVKIKRFIWNLLKNTLINFYWVFFKLFLFKPKVSSKSETIQQIINRRLSISRFGDGEFRLMTKKGKIGFQDANDELSDALIDSFNERKDNLLICSFNFKEKRPLNNYAGKWLKSFVFYTYIKPLFDKNYVYGNTDITRFYNPAFFEDTDFHYLEREYIPFLKKIWEGRNVIIVEGEQTKLGVGNDLFESCNSLKRIVCPSKNAFDKYDKILKCVVHHYSKDDLVLLALGPTASVLAVQLCVDYNIQTIDIGHIDVVYYWYLNRCKVPYNIEGKYVNEALPGSGIIKVRYDVDKYKKEIVDSIL